MDSYFKVLCAAEEVERLNVEIPHLMTFMWDEEAYLIEKETELASTDPILAHQVHIFCTQHGHFTLHHTAILNQLTALPGFNGGSFFGVRKADQIPDELPTTPVLEQPLLDNRVVEKEMIDEEDDLAAEQAGEDQDKHLVGAFYIVLEMSNDGGTLISI